MADPIESTGDEVVIARYQARASDVRMIRFGAPIAAVVMIVLGIMSGNRIGLLVFWTGAVILVVRWLWVTMLGTRPLAFNGEITADELRMTTMRGTTTIPPRGAQSLMPVGYKRKGRGPRALVTSGGTFTIYPDGTGFDEFIGAISTVGGGLRIDDDPKSTQVESALPATGSLGVLRRAQMAESGDVTAPGRVPQTTSGGGADLAPGVVAVGVLGSQSLADQAVAKLDAAGITALALPSASGIGGVRITVKEEDRARAEEILAGD